MPAGSPAPAAPARAAVTDSSGIFDANQLRLHVTNLGWFTDGNQAGALEWPRGADTRVIFTAGLWIGARVAAETLVTVAEYSTEYAAGPLDENGSPIDPGETDPAHRVFSIRRCDDAASNPDWAAWPAVHGAPVTASGAPRVIGDQTLFAVFHDANPARHTNAAGGTAPLGVEVRETVYGFHRGGDLERVVFLEFDLRNRGANTLDSAYVAFWCDPDLGGAGDDLVGSDTALAMGYVYNGPDLASGDYAFGSHPPAVGVTVLQGPVVAGDVLGMTSFGRLLKNWNEPMNRGMSYRRMVRGLYDAHRPPPFPCDVPGTRFEVSGDPVAGTGCRDTIAADRRFMVSSGPFTMVPGDSQRFVVALAVGGRPGEGDRLSNLTRLRETVAFARDAWRTGFANVPAAVDCSTPPRVIAASPNPSGGVQRFDFIVASNVERVTVRIHDIGGRLVRELRFGGLRPGLQAFEWDGRGEDHESLPAGLYFVRVDDGRAGGAGRVVRLR